MTDPVPNYYDELLTHLCQYKTMGHTRIGVFGAAFDPPTKGHEDALIQASKHFDKILLIPSLSHAFGKKMTDISIRLEMLEAFIQACQNPILEINLIEKELLSKKPAPIYTFDVMEALERAYPKATLKFIIGPDNAASWSQFYKADEIKKRWGVFEVKEQLPIHSTQVRAVYPQRLSPQALKNQLTPLLHQEVAKIIKKHHLYFD